jgi:hypothetical protein
MRIPVRVTGATSRTGLAPFFFVLETAPCDHLVYRSRLRQRDVHPFINRFPEPWHGVTGTNIEISPVGDTPHPDGFAPTCPSGVVSSGVHRKEFSKRRSPSSLVCPLPPLPFLCLKSPNPRLIKRSRSMPPLVLVHTSFIKKKLKFNLTYESSSI